MEVYSGLDLKKIEKTSLNAKHSNNGCLISANGNLNIELPELATDCKLFFSKKQGFDGVVVINGAVHQIISLKSEIVLKDIREIVIGRQDGAKGNLILSKIEYEHKEANVSFRELAKSLGHTVGIKVLDDGIHASEYSKILNADIIKSLATFPANAYVRKGDEIVFLTACKIVSANSVIPTSIVMKQEIMSNKSVAKGKCFVFESGCALFSSIKSPFIILNGSGSLILDRKSIIDIDNIYLEPNTRYIIEIIGSNLGGNGRSTIDVYDGNNFLYKKSFTFQSSKGKVRQVLDMPPGDPKIKILRDGMDATGAVMIDSIKIFSESYNIETDKVFNPIFVPKAQDKYTKHNLYDKKYLNSYRDNSIFELEQVDKVIDSSFNFSICPKSYSMLNWVSKWKNMFPNITVNSLQYSNCESDKSDDSIILTNIYNLKKSNIIFLDEFCDSLNSKQIEIISSAKTVFSTSVINVQYLRKYCKQVIYTPKYWPYYGNISRTIKENYIVVICRDELISKYLDENLKLDKKVIFVGARGDFKNTFYRDNLKYAELLSLILYSDVVVDISNNLHYYSGLLDLCLMAQKNIVTNNNWLGICRPAKHLLESFVGSDSLVIDINDLVDKINKCSPTEPNLDLDSYNYNLYGTMLALKEAIQ